MKQVSLSRRLAAWTSVLILGVATAVVVVALYRNTPALAIGLPGLALIVIAAWWVITEIGLRRVLSVFPGSFGLGLLVAALILTVGRPGHVVVRTLTVLGILSVSFALVRYASTRPVPNSYGINASDRPSPPRHPVLLCNPWSGGGKVERFGLLDLATELGVETVLLDKGLDLEQLTRDAVARGADCLGMAGGDGSQALVASVAVEHDLPFVCISAGTRNHFALDLGLDREDPRAGMHAFRDAVERRVDYATVNDRLFVNNVSLGIYATIVQSEDYRDAKIDISRSMITDLLGRQAEPFDLEYTTPNGREIVGAFLIMVSNNQYILGAKRDVSQRRRLDSGRLGVFAVSTRTGSQAAFLVTLSVLGLRNLSSNWYEFTADEFEVRSHSGLAYMGVDGEALESPTPLKFKIHPQGLRLYVPEGNLEVAERRRARDWSLKRLSSIAMGHEPA